VRQWWGGYRGSRKILGGKTCAAVVGWVLGQQGGIRWGDVWDIFRAGAVLRMGWWGYEGHPRAGMVIRAFIWLRLFGSHLTLQCLVDVLRYCIIAAIASWIVQLLESRIGWVADMAVVGQATRRSRALLSALAAWRRVRHMTQNIQSSSSWFWKTMVRLLSTGIDDSVVRIEIGDWHEWGWLTTDLYRISIIILQPLTGDRFSV